MKGDTQVIATVLSSDKINPTDVLAGWLLGGLWFLVCLPLLSHGRFEAPADSPVPG